MSDSGEKKSSTHDKSLDYLGKYFDFTFFLDCHPNMINCLFKAGRKNQF